MRNYDTSQISLSSQAPGKSATFDFLQTAYKEITTATLQSLITNSVGSYSTASAYAIWGLEVTGSGPYNVATGSVLLNGEVYDVNGASGLVNNVGGYYAWGYPTTTYDPIADPTTMSDYSVKNLHQIRKMTLTSTQSTPGGGFLLTSVVRVPTLATTTYVGTAISTEYTGSSAIGWTASGVTYSSGWSTDASFPFRYAKSAAGEVIFKGRISKSTAPSVAGKIIDLPASVMPTHTGFYPISYYNNSNYNTGLIQVDLAGGVTLYGFSYSSGTIDFWFSSIKYTTS